VALVRSCVFGRKTWLICLLPLSPSQRFGWETRCEVVEPTDPLTGEPVAR
jgi:hypothetical protein